MWPSRTWRVVVAVSMTAVVALGACSSDRGTTAASPTSTTAGTPHVRADQLDGAIAQAMKDASIPGAIVGIWGADGDYVRSFGVADKQTRAPMQTDFYTRIGSVTKTFTVTALLQLVDQGKVALDDPI